MTQLNITASGSIMSFYSNELPQYQADAWAYTTTKAQMDARQVNPDPSTKSYFDAMINSYQQLGWAAISLGKYEHPKTEGKTTPANIIIELLNSSLSEFSQFSNPTEKIRKIFNYFKESPTSVQSFLDWFWDKTYINAQQSHMVICPIYTIGNQMIVLTNYYYFSFEMSSWPSLFDGYDSSTLNATIKVVSMTLDMCRYKQIEDHLHTELGHSICEHVKNTTLDI